MTFQHFFVYYIGCLVGLFGFIGSVEPQVLRNLDSRDSHIWLTMCEEVLRKVDANNFECLSLSFVGGHSKTQSDRELFAYHFNGQRPVCWVEFDPGNHDRVACNKEILLIILNFLTINKL